MPIPNIFHFIAISPMRIELYHYLAITSAHDIHKPDKIYLYTDKEQTDNIYWNLLLPIITPEIITIPHTFHGISINFPQYQADIIRLEKLIERGGIYMDIDNLSIRPFTEFLNTTSVIMGGSIDSLPNVKVIGKEHIKDLDAISNSIIMTPPNNPFLKKWYEELPNNLINKPWAWHAVCLPREILKQNDYDINILHWNNYFCPIHMMDNNPFIFDSSCNHMIDKITTSYTLVFYQTMVYDKYLKNITYEYMLTNDNIFTKLYRKYVQSINPETLFILCRQYYENGQFKLLEDASKICLFNYPHPHPNHDISKFYLEYSKL